LARRAFRVIHTLRFCDDVARSSLRAQRSNPGSAYSEARFLSIPLSWAATLCGLRPRDDDSVKVLPLIAHAWTLGLLLFCATLANAQPLTKPYAAAELRSGATFMAAQLQKQQADDDQNPAMLWVDSGRTLFERDCKSCHVDAKGLAAKLPRAIIDASSKRERVATLESQINVCQSTRVIDANGKQKSAYGIESEPLLSLASYVAFSSRGMKQEVASNITQTTSWQRARAMFFAVQGKLDFSCAACHDKIAGKRVRTQAISQGHGVGFPVYRVEWQTVGSLNRRLRACFFGMEANVPAASDPILSELELYLSWRSEGLALEAPAVRR
jgi:L-cysteine S-thiosulfotransferase